MTLPPLPLIDGKLFIDNSFIELLTTCPRALQYNSLLRRIGAGENAALNFGTAIHHALEYRYRNYRNVSPDLFLEDELAVLLGAYFDEHPCPEDDWRNLNWAIEVMKKYNERYANEPFNLLVGDDGVPLVEMSFALPLFKYNGWFLKPLGEEPMIEVVYTGKIDLPVIWDDQLFIIDHKTTSMLGDQFFNEMRMSAQQKGYSWAFQTLTGRKVAGFCINAIRSKQPPQYVLNGAEKDYRGKKLTPTAWWQESLQRERVYLKDGDLDEWKDNLIHLVEEFFFNYQRAYFPMKTKWCAMYGKCQYYDVCSLAAPDRGLMLSSGLFANNVWTPLKQPQTNEKKHS